MNFDLDQLDTRAACAAGADMDVLHPVTKAKLGWTIRLIGTDAEQFQSAVNRQSDARMELLRNGKTFTSADNQKNSIDLLVAATVGWNGIIRGGKPFEFSMANARILYTQYPWVAEQVDAFISGRRNFLDTSPKA